MFAWSAGGSLSPLYVVQPLHACKHSTRANCSICRISQRGGRAALAYPNKDQRPRPLNALAALSRRASLIRLRDELSISNIYHSLKRLMAFRTLCRYAHCCGCVLCTYARLEQHSYLIGDRGVDICLWQVSGPPVPTAWLENAFDTRSSFTCYRVQV